MDDGALMRPFLSLALDVGESMLRSGAEVNRVEDTITRICRAYGASRVDVFTITSSIVVTVHGEGFGMMTETRRINASSYNLYKLDLLNRLSRSVCEKKPAAEEIAARLERIEHTKRYGFAAQLFIYGLISSAFSVFFGGSASDAAAAAVIGILIRIIDEPMTRLNVSRIFSSFAEALFAGFAAYLAVTLGLAEHADLISIGNTMLLIPGVVLTNAVRDLFQGDTIAGLARFAEAIIIANMVVLGVSVSAMLISL